MVSFDLRLDAYMRATKTMASVDVKIVSIVFEIDESNTGQLTISHDDAILS